MKLWMAGFATVLLAVNADASLRWINFEWEVNTTSHDVFAQQTAQNSYSGVTLNSCDVMWFDDYLNALWLIPENQLRYASVEAMVASNTFKFFLSSDGDIRNTTGWRRRTPPRPRSRRLRGSRPTPMCISTGRNILPAPPRPTGSIFFSCRFPATPCTFRP
jgi:hypothetical protein